MPFYPTKIPGGKELIDAEKLLKGIGIKPGMKIADLGCGLRGYFALHAARLVGSHGLVYGVDVLRSALKGVQSSARLLGITNVKTVWSDLEVFKGTRIPEESLDLALLINVLFQVRKREEVIKEAKRLIKKGGKILIVDWGKDSSFGPKKEDRVSPEEIKEIAKKLQLELEREFSAGPYHFALLFVK